MKILFLLPASGYSPAGGYKVVYEYANRLSADNYEVGIVYPSYKFKFREKKIITILRKFKALVRFIMFAILRRYSCRNWFKLDRNIKEYWVWSLDEKFVPKSDIYIATAIHTSVYLNQYKYVSSNNKFYFIQGFEKWNEVNKNDVIATYHFNMRKLVIAEWLKEIVNSVNEECILIQNGFDFTYFKKTIDIHLRNKYTVCMMFHTSSLKGCDDGFKALDIVKKRYPKLKVNIFGVPPRPKDLPDWYNYFQKPDRETHNRIYNESAIFIGTSWSEGWGLTVGEAMICGCAVACTNNLGYLEMADDGETALVSEIKKPELLANNIIRLIESDELRYKIAEKGNNYIKQFSWDKSYEKFSSFMTNN